MATVQRQLNLYGFKCYSSGENKGAFAHPQFLQGHKDEAGLIQRYYAPKKQAEINKKAGHNNKKRSMMVMLEEDSVDAEEEEVMKSSRFTKRRGVAIDSVDDESVGSFGTNCDSSLTTSCCDQKSSCVSSSSSSSYPMYQCDWHTCNHNNNNNNANNNNNFQHLFDTFVEKQSVMNLSLSHPDNYNSASSQLFLDNAAVPSFDVSLFPLEEPVSPITPNIDAFAEYYYRMVSAENMPQTQLAYSSHQSLPEATNHNQDTYNYSQEKMFATNNSYNMLSTQDTPVNHQYNTTTPYTSSEPVTCEIGINTDLSQGWGYDPMSNYFPFGYGI